MCAKNKNALVLVKSSKPRQGRKRTNVEITLLRQKIFEMLVDGYKAYTIKKELKLTNGEWVCHSKAVDLVFEQIAKEGGIKRVGKRISQYEEIYQRALDNAEDGLAMRALDSITKYEGDQGVTAREAEKVKIEGPNVYAAVALLVNASSKEKAAPKKALGKKKKK